MELDLRWTNFSKKIKEGMGGKGDSKREGKKYWEAEGNKEGR